MPPALVRPDAGAGSTQAEHQVHDQPVQAAGPVPAIRQRAGIELLRRELLGRLG